MANYATSTSNMMDRRCTTTSTLRSPPGTSGLRSPPDRKEWTVCSLQEGCLSLDQILKSFSAPISEEHAWAVIHQSLVCLSRLLEALEDDLYLVTSTKHIWLRTDGCVDPRTFIPPGEEEIASFEGKRRMFSENARAKTVDENKVIAELGVVIYNALDFGNKTEEERQLSPELEHIIDILTSTDEQEKEEELFDTEDEGIEKDEQHSNHVSTGLKKDGNTCLRLMQLCRNHLAVASEAEAHFKAVCRALVSEALELSSFMEKVSQSRGGRESDNELNELNLHDWANLWIQVMHELRNGLKLKKIEYTKTPYEYELTPYEILMDDIRSRRYKLNKVIVDGRVPPRVKKDAHDIILEFIRSRPPLKPASERKLTECRKQSTPMDLLLESIRSESSRKSLRKITGPPEKRPLVLTGLESSRCKLDDSWQPSPNYNRRVIQPDQELMDNLLNFSGDEDEDENDESEAPLEISSPIHSVAAATTPSNNKQHTKAKKDWHKTLAHDLVIHGPTRKVQRRHSVSVCQTPVHKKITKRNQLFPDSREKKVTNWRNRKFAMSERRSNPNKVIVQLDPDNSFSQESPPDSMTSEDNLVSVMEEEECNGTGPGGHGGVGLSPTNLSSPNVHSTNLHSEFIKSEEWMSALQTLELSLDEVVHIRSVLSRAEFEALPLDNNLKTDVEKGKICFMCKKTRFSLFSWGTRCSLCKQQVCHKCVSKMRIPLEHFASVPVSALTPHHHHHPSSGQSSSTTTSNGSSPMASLSPIPQLGSLKERVSSPNLTLPRGLSSAGSAPTSPNPRRRFSGCSSTTSGGGGPTSLPVFTSQGITTVSARLEDGRRHSFSRDTGSLRSRRESIQGTPLTVCHDCKEMVLQVVRSQNASRRGQMTRSLYLQLSPGYTPEI